jgi:Fe2+ or Zn2+ uptake regulation protein
MGTNYNLIKKMKSIKQSGHRMTQQRKTILDILNNAKMHPSADEIYEMVKQKLPRISLGTVYRNLEVLSKLGVIQVLELSGSLKRFDWDPNKHYHIRCIRCDRVENAPIAPMRQLENKLYKSTIFEIIGHNLEFTGLCPKCTENMS